MSPKITEMDTIQLLATVLGGKILANQGSRQKIGPDEKKVGVISSRVSRSLYTAHSIFAYDIIRHQRRLKLRHRSHNCQRRHAGREIDLKTIILMSKKEMLKRILWQSIAGEHPQALMMGSGLREGWRLICKDTDPDYCNEKPLLKIKAISKIFVSRISDIVRGKYVSINEDGLRPIARGEEVIGSIDNEKIQTLYTYMDELQEEFTERVPKNLTKTSPTLNVKKAALDTMTIILLSNHSDILTEILHSIFWNAVRDAVPAGYESGCIAIRRAWDVVRCPPPATTFADLIKTCGNQIPAKN